SRKVQPVGTLGPGKEAVPGKDQGYQHLTGARAWVVGPSAWDFVGAGNKHLRVWFAGPREEQVIACTGIGYWLEQKVPCLIRRVHDRKARFATVYDLTGTGKHVTAFLVTKETDLLVR